MRAMSWAAWSGSRWSADERGRVPRSLRFAVRERQRYRELQALEDAVNFRLAAWWRRARAASPVPWRLV